MLFTACQKDKTYIENAPDKDAGKETVEKAVYVENDMLAFPTSESFFETIEQVGNMTDEELDIWEKNLGFISLRKRINDAMDRLDEAKTEQEFEEMLQKYSDIIEVTGDNAVRPRITDFIYTTISNEKRLYRAGEKLNKIFKDYVVSSDLGNFEKLNDITVPQDFLDDKSLDVFKYAENSMNKSNCGTYQNAYYQSGSRRVFVDASRFYYRYYDLVFNWHVNFYVKIYMYGEKKSWRWWKSYKTVLSFERTKSKFRHPEVNLSGSGWQYSTSYISNWSASTSYDSRTLTKYKYFGSAFLGSNTIPSYGWFEGIECYATSRGVGNNFAHIQCGY